MFFADKNKKLILMHFAEIHPELKSFGFGKEANSHVKSRKDFLRQNKEVVYIVGACNDKSDDLNLDGLHCSSYHILKFNPITKIVNEIEVFNHIENKAKLDEDQFVAFRNASRFVDEFYGIKSEQD